MEMLCYKITSNSRVGVIKIYRGGKLFETNPHNKDRFLKLCKFDKDTFIHDCQMKKNNDLPKVKAILADNIFTKKIPLYLLNTPFDSINRFYDYINNVTYNNLLQFVDHYDSDILINKNIISCYWIRCDCGKETKFVH